MNCESNGDGTSRAMTQEKRDQVRKKIDALTACFRLLSNPIMRKEYVKSKVSSPPKTPTPRSNDSQRNSPMLTPRTPTTSNIQSTPHSSSGQKKSHPQVQFIDDEFDMIALRHNSTSSESASEYSDEVQQQPKHISPQSLTYVTKPPQTRTPLANNKRDVSDLSFNDKPPFVNKSSPRGLSNRITVDDSYTPTFRESTPFIQENDAQDSFDEIINSVSSEERVIPMIQPKTPNVRNVDTYKGRSSSKPLRGNNNNKDDSTVTTEYSEDLSFEPDRSRKADQANKGGKEMYAKNKKVYEEEEDDEAEDDDDEYSYDDDTNVHSESLDDNTTSYESTIYTSRTFGQRMKDRSFRDPEMCGCVQEDVQGSVSDTISALDQVLNVFSISDKELNGFSRALHRAEKDLG